jgi:hypothetical protein
MKTFSSLALGLLVACIVSADPTIEDRLRVSITCERVFGPEHPG